MEDAGLLILIPAFNEEKRIAGVVASVRAAVPDARVVVVDDGSSDATASEAEEAGAEVVRLPFNLGYGAALQTGFKYALKRPFSSLVTMDGDGQHDPGYIQPLVSALEECQADVVIGSRFLKETGYRGPLLKRMGMVFFSFLASLFARRRITDPTSGFQAMRPVVVELCAGEHYPVDYPDADVIIMLVRAGFRVTEVPVRMVYEPGTKSMHRGLKPVYYVFKMLLSIVVTLLRKRAVLRDERSA